ncbi:MAG: 2-C-methyl-D-erythritol 2,4-cyclodiphosphate synthase [Actinomycetota bacterium]
MRVGLGFDAHRFAAGRPLVLGTIAIDHDRGLAGHSDGDVLTHAIVDAILGAAALGDIGTHFPSSDPRWKDVDSSIFLSEVLSSVRLLGLDIANIDVTVVCEVPRLEPYREKMQSAIASALGVEPEAVSVKATTTDTMGFTGRGEGVAAFAVALIRPA